MYRTGSIQPFTAELLSLGLGVFKTLQMIVYEPLPGRRFPISHVPTAGTQPLHAMSSSSPQSESNAVMPDPYGLETWDQNYHAVLFIHFLEPGGYEKVTGLTPPLPRKSKDIFTGYHLP
jgi:hypothetical protein